jgi:hypothetical protein
MTSGRTVSEKDPTVSECDEEEVVMQLAIVETVGA